MNININLCRVCLKQGTGINIYTGDILEKFLFTTLVQVEKNDGLSEIICKRCLARLQIAYDFKKEAISSNRELRSFISDVNKQFKQVTSSGGTSKVSKKRTRKESEQQNASNESFDELDDDIQDLISDEYRDLDGDLSDDNKPIDRDELVEILGDNSAITIRKTRSMRTVKEDIDDEVPENMEVFLVDENTEVDPNYIVYDYEQQPEDAMTDESEEPQFLEDEENDEPDNNDPNDEDYDDQLYEIGANTRKKPQKPRTVAASSLDNRCDICHKSFSTRTNLTRHKITHEGRKPYVCTICGNSFTQNGSLKSHMLIHTGERPFKCDECGQGFTQSKSLVFHKRRHTGEKPFPCDHCGIRFRQKDCLKRHIIAKHAPDRVKHFVCHVCGKNLLCKYSLKMHLSRHSAHEVVASEKKRQKTGDTNNASGNDLKSEDADKNHDTADEYEELLACEICDQVYTNSADFMSHRATHPESNEEHIE